MALRKTAVAMVLVLAAAAHAAPRKKSRKAPPPAATESAATEDLLAPALDPNTKLDSDLVKQGLQAYEDLDYGKCVELLQKALSETLTREEKLLTYKTLAFCHVGMDKPDAAKFDFENLLHLDENFELDRRISPRVRAPFEEAKAAIATGQSVEGEANELQFRAKNVTPIVKPLRPAEGQPVSVATADPTGLAMSAELFFRTRGQPVFSKTSGKGDKGKFELTVPGLQVQPPALEYYLVLLDEQNTSVARAGNQRAPILVEVAMKKRPVYTRGWFWGVIAGVVVAGAVVGGVVGATVTTPIPSGTPASVTIQPQ